MKFTDLIPLAIKALVINKGRSALTMLGIVIGIASVILMVAVGQAAERYLMAQVAAFGSDLVFVSSGRGDDERGGGPSPVIKQTLTEKDYRKLKAQSWATAVSAAAMSSDLIAYSGVEKFSQVQGSAPGEIVVFNSSVAQGRFLDDADVEGHSRVIVLGEGVAKNLFGEEDPLGKTLKVSKRPFRVIGVLGPSGTRFFSEVDEQVFIPYTAFFDLYNKDRLSFIAIKSSDVPPTEAKELVRATLRETHGLDNPGGDLSKDDFRVGSQEDAARNADVIGKVLQILLASIASISLFVAGIGIMNIMYVTVTERTREIGLRKALGASRRDVLGQFLAEAVILTAFAGLLGIMVGTSLSWITIFILKFFQSGWSFAMPWQGAIIGFGVSALIGVAFGYFPARTAARLTPVEALRHE